MTNERDARRRERRGISKEHQPGKPIGKSRRGGGVGAKTNPGQNVQRACHGKKRKDKPNTYSERESGTTAIYQEKKKKEIRAEKRGTNTEKKPRENSP